MERARPLALAALLGAILLTRLPGRAQGEEPRVERGALATAVLEDADRVPPGLAVPVEALTRLPGVAEPRGLVVRKTGLSVDWEGDGRADLSVRAGRPTPVKARRQGGGTAPVLLYDRGAGWFGAPAGLVRGSVGGHAFEVLDADLDGRFDGAADLLRVDQGAFFLPAPERRVPLGDGLARFTLTLAGDVWSLSLRPEAAPAGTSPQALQGLGAVNAFRSRTGLAPLALEALWSAGCQKHADYIRLNPSDGFGHAEQPGRPGWSAEGHEAAVEGVMERTGSPARAVERLTAMLMHRTPFLADPTVGLGVGASGPPQGGAGDARLGPPGFSVLRAGRALGSKGFPVVCPGPGQADVPLTLLEEVPTPDPRKDLYAGPRGYAVSVSFLTGAAPPGSLRLNVAGRREPLPAIVFSPAAPLHPSFAHNYATVFLVPEEPLAPRTTYEATYTPAEGSAAGALCWRFTTGTRGP